VASNKRQRKKTNQAARRAALEAARKRQQRNRQIRNFAGLGLAVLLAGALITFIASRGDDGDSASAPTTTSGPASTLATVPPVPPGREVKGDTPCPKPTGEARATKFEKPPPTCIDPAKAYKAVFATSAGVIKVELDTQRTPATANNFVVLARYGYYDGSSFPRTDTSIDIIQGGSPNTQSISDPGPGYNIKDEGGKFTYAEGDLTMARSQGADSASAQFFFSAGPKTASLDGQGTYVTFGKTVEGLDVLKKVLGSHVDCPPDDGGSGSCLGGAPQPPVTVESVTIEES
jgi:cyclophilin family peptidyl-prolyl cis-trans isomerase